MNAEKPCTVIAIDDHPLFLKGVADLINLVDSLDLIGAAASGQDGLDKAVELKPDLILLDMNMKGMGGIETLKAIKATDLESRVVMLTVSDSEDHVVAAFRAGADGYLLKDMEPEDILERLQIAASGHFVISDELTELLAHALREDALPKNPSQAGLTEREEQILELISGGFSNKLIARKLDITEGTVKVHVKHMLKKLNLRSRLEAAVWAVNSKKDG